MKQLKWTTVVYYVDEDTGEQLTKQQSTELYTITSKSTTYDINEQKQTATRSITYICTKRPVIQSRLF